MKPQPRRNFYSLAYPEAMKVALAVSRRTGTMDWTVYREWMNKYDAVHARRQARLGQQVMAFAEKL